MDGDPVKDRVYLETTIVSYLCARPSRDLVVAAHQQITREWWATQRSRFDLYVSEIVLQEASDGDLEAASRRLEALSDINVLVLTDDASEIARSLVDRIALPEKVYVDALHIAVAVVSGMDYLLTWNCAHIANAAFRQRIDDVCRFKGYEPPIICTPEELMEA